MGTWPFICSVLRSEPLCFSKRSQQLYTMNILLFLNCANVAKLSHVAILFLFTPGAARQLRQCCQPSNRCLSLVFFYWKKSEIKVFDASFCSVFTIFPLPPILHSPHLSEPFFWAVTHAAWKAFFFSYLIFILPPPALSSSAPCRIQWHSFLMRLLSLLISVSFCKNEWQLAL